MDIVSKKKRSQMMSGIRAKNTKPEIKVRQFIFSKGFRYRIHKKIHGIKPDIVMKKWNICIFINGCYWHRHENCKLTSFPKTNRDFWEKKFEQNIKRDKKNIEILQKNGWRVGVIWECSIRNETIFSADIENLIKTDNYWQYPIKTKLKKS